MHLLFVRHFLNEAIIRALCWTFLHSLWQGFLLAIIAAVVMLATRRQTATLRYNMLFALFALFLSVTGFTFAQQLHIATGDAAVAAPVSEITLTAAHADGAIPQIATPSSVANFILYFNQHAALIVTIWFIIFLAKSVRMLSGLVYLQKIRYNHIYTPPVFWLQCVSELSVRLQLSVPVQLLESGIVKVPVVIGIIKPVILLPMGLLSSLPQDQLEAILLHELAHIRRGDYFVNLVQTVAETLFFFNPAVLWVSSLIKEERENCCDDIAVSATRSKLKFINALIAFKEYNDKRAPALANAFPGSGRKSYLLDRAKRIVHNKNKTLNNMEKLSVLCCLVFVCTLLLFFSAPQRSSAASVNTIRKPAVVAGEPASVKKLDTPGKPGMKSGTQRILGDTSAKDTTHRDLLKEVIADLEKEKLVKPEEVESLSFKLTASELIINDVKQPGEIQKKLSEKYITLPTMKIMYHWRGE